MTASGAHAETILTVAGRSADADLVKMLLEKEFAGVAINAGETATDAALRQDGACVLMATRQALLASRAQEPVASANATIAMQGRCIDELRSFISHRSAQGTAHIRFAEEKLLGAEREIGKVMNELSRDLRNAVAISGFSGQSLAETAAKIERCCRELVVPLLQGIGLALRPLSHSAK